MDVIDDQENATATEQCHKEFEAAKNSRCGYLGHFIRTCNEVERLMLSRNNREAVLECQDKMLQQYEKLVHAHQLCTLLLPNESERKALDEVMSRDECGKNEMFQRIKEWLSEETTKVAPSEHGTVASNSSTSSSVKRKEALVEKQVAELKHKQLLEKQEIEKEKRRLEMLSEVKVIEDEIEQAKLKAQLWDDDNLGEELKAAPLLNPNAAVYTPFTHLKEFYAKNLPVVKTEPHLPPVQPHSTRPSLMTNAEYGVSDSKQRQMPPDVSYVPNSQQPPDVNDRQRAGYQPENVQNTTRTQHDLMMQTANSLSALTASLTLPKPELLTFSGDARDYTKFITNFEINLASKVMDPRLKLSYLIQHCSGEARSVIEDCVLLEPEVGYERAHELLRNNYGRPHVVARCFIDRLVKGPLLKPNDTTGLINLSQQMVRCEMTLQKLGYVSDLNCTETLKGVVKRLPNHLRTRWVERAFLIIETGVEPGFSDLCKFVQERVNVASSVYGQDFVNDSKVDSGKVTTLTTVNNDGFSSDTKKMVWTKKCKVCQNDHYLDDCGSFANMPMKQKKECVKEHKLCFNCLKGGHLARECRREPMCDSCNKKHHRLIHLDPPPQEHDSSTNHTSQKNPGVCLQIVPVLVYGDGSYAEVFALLDPGSTTTLCNEKLLSRLKVKGKPKSYSITTINGSKMRKGCEAEFKVSAMDNSSTIELKGVRTVDSLGVSLEYLPTDEIAKRWPHLDGLQFPRINEEEVMLLIGNDVGKAFWVLDQRRGQDEEPYAVRYPLGWVLFGLTGFHNSCMNTNVNFQQADVLQQQIELMLKAEFDSTSDPRTCMSIEDKQALNIMTSTVQKKEGKYQVAMPVKEKPVRLENNYLLAESRLKSLKKKLQRDETLHQKYTETMQDYITKEYAKKVTGKEGRSSYEQDQVVWYLPHHPVVNPNKPGKVRIVFDCAAKFRGKSLNDVLLQGPDLVNNLVGVLMRFRQEPVALVADIEAMFHQVKVTQDDCNLLRFLWWTDGDISKEPEVYHMQVHLFGATSSPSCTAFCLRRTADDNQHLFSQEALDTVNRNFYVDDCLKSVATASLAVRLAKELRDLLNKGGFKLTKWLSNSKEVLESIPESERAPSVKSIEFEENSLIERALGIRWNIGEDTFTFKVQPEDKPLTKRGILSMASSLYDPLGLVAPVTLLPKLVLQELCRRKRTWDEPVDEDLIPEWKDWLKELPSLSLLAIPRCIKPQMREGQYGVTAVTEMHHFADASTKAYGAASYLKVTDVHGNIQVTLLIGKSRVAPIKEMTVPRLELSAAVVAVRLHQIVMRELDLKINKIYFWSDSMSTLHYIRNRTKRFKVFVANRLTIIHDATEVDDWYYVPTDQNPADIASRGVKPTDAKLQCWLNGPDFLRSNTYPKQPNAFDVVVEDDVRTATITTSDTVTVIDRMIERHSKWKKLQTSIAWLLRFKTHLHDKYIRNVNTEFGQLKVDDMKTAEYEVVKYVQQQIYHNEIECLEANMSVPRSSPIAKLCPVLHNNLICVGGRLENATIGENMKHPIILPSKHHLTALIIRHMHEINGHTGVQHVLSLLRSNYWIIHGVSAVKREIGNCFNCRRRNKKPESQIMAQLPPERLKADKPPFSYIGVDYFGPLMVKVKRSHEKRYGCLITCLATRAVHIEIAHSLDTDSFLAALSRFVARRGKPQKVFSDNGTNLTKGERELRECVRKFNNQQIHCTLLQREIEWSFNPPTASHMGGVWERMIRSTRQIFSALINKNRLLSDEALLTFIAETERILNDRPITTVSDDVKDLDPLTPSKLLLLRGNASLPLGIFDKDDSYSRRWWRQAQYYANQFWNRWIKEYIPLLQPRSKWLRPKENLKAGDIVLVCEENVQRGEWPLGRVLDVCMGRDGYVRSVKLRVGGTVKVRPISKLCLLERVDGTS